MVLSVSPWRPRHRRQRNAVILASNVNSSFQLTEHWPGLALTAMAFPLHSQATDAVAVSRPSGLSSRINFRYLPTPTERSRRGRDVALLMTWPTIRLEPVPSRNKASPIGSKPIRRSGTASLKRDRAVYPKSLNSTVRKKTRLVALTAQSRMPCIWL